MIETIVVFANSLKNGERCVAGKCKRTKNWIRPVSDNNGSAIKKSQTKILNERTKKTWPLKPLQIIRLDITEHAPLANHQPENYVINPNYQWTDHYKISAKEAEAYLDSPDDLWGEGNKVDYEEIQNLSVTISNSLYLIKICELKLRIRDNRRRAIFTYNMIEYDLPVTDQNFDNLMKENQETTLSNVIICVSLGEEYKGYCYKLVASIIQ